MLWSKQSLWAATTEPSLCAANIEAHAPYTAYTTTTEPHAAATEAQAPRLSCNRNDCDENPANCNEEYLHLLQLESPCKAMKTQRSQKRKNYTDGEKK